MHKLFAVFTEHPASVGESYSAHMATALRFGARMLYCGVACLIHAFLPFLFVKTGSNTITRLHDIMVVNRNRIAQNTAATNHPQTKAKTALTGSSQSSC